MTKTMRTLSERIADADARGGSWLADGNAHAEAGRARKAQACWDKGQYWLDLSNRLREQQCVEKYTAGLKRIVKLAESGGNWEIATAAKALIEK